MYHLNHRLHGGYRRGVVGIFLVLIIFAALFIAGFSYYLFASTSSLAAEQGAVGKQEGIQGAKGENLVVTVGPGSGTSCAGCVLGVSAENSGSVPVTITAVFVTTPSGNALSSSTNPSDIGSEFLVSGGQVTGDLNITLPLTLAPGEGTGAITGCGPATGCNIGIQEAACVSCLTSGEVYVNLLTARGNTFTTEYCPSSCSSESGSGSTLTKTSTSTITSTSYFFSSSSTTTTLFSVTSSTTVGGFQAGTNSLIVLMQACAGTSSPGATYGTTCASPQPPAVYSTEEVVLIVTVNNYASVAMSVSISYQSVATNGASVTPQSSSTSPPIPSGADNCVSGQTSPAQVISAGGSGTFVCTFIATQGSAGGTVTFLGYAAGTYPPPPSTATGYVTSAEAISNPVQIGNPQSSVAGPFVGLSFEYASEEQTTFGSAVQVPAGTGSSGSEDVIWQATVLNTANASVTILEYSFLLVARIAQEHDFYIVQPVSSWSSTLSAYACALGTANAPTGAQCSTAQKNCTVLGNGCVPVGDTATVDFAASGIDSASWEWGGSSGFNPPETVTMFVIVEYDYYNAGAWHVMAQAIPFTGTYFTG